VKGDDGDSLDGDGKREEVKTELYKNDVSVNGSGPYKWV